MPKPIQEQFGESVIGLFADFARSETKSIDDLKADEFSHVRDADLRQGLAQVFYGARWIYKLGLALLTKDEERAAHIRAQVVDYSSICEALLSYCLGYAIKQGHTVGTNFNWRDPDRKQQAITWARGSVDDQLRRQSMWWLIRIASEFHIISPQLAKDLQWLRTERNMVHIRERTAVGSQAYLNQSRKAFDLLTQTIAATKRWKNLHP